MAPRQRHHHSWNPLDLTIQPAIREALGVEGDPALRYCECQAVLVGRWRVLLLRRTTPFLCHAGCDTDMRHLGTRALAKQAEAIAARSLLRLGDTPVWVLDAWTCRDGHVAVDQYRTAEGANERPPLIVGTTALYFRRPVVE